MESGAPADSMLVAVFADIAKAFDMVNRDMLFGLLKSIGAWGSHIKILRIMYCNVKASVRINGRYSDWFPSNSGVQQGDPILPLLFIIYLSKRKLDDPDDPFLLGDALVPVSMLLLADDLILLLLSLAGMQRKLGLLDAWATEWKMKISPETTVFMVFNRPDPPVYIWNFFLGDLQLKRVSAWTLNGFDISLRGWVDSVKTHVGRKLSRSTQQASTLMVLRKRIGMPSPKDFYSLYLSTVESLLLYGVKSAMYTPWALLRKIDDLQVKFARCALRVASTSTCLLVLFDLGAFPLSIQLTFLCLKFLVYSLSSTKNSPVRVAVLHCIKLSQWGYGWFLELRSQMSPFQHLLLFLDPFEPPAVDDPFLLSLPNRFLELSLNKLSADLHEQLQSFCYASGIQLLPPVLTYCLKGWVCRPYTRLLFCHAQAVERLRTSTHL